MSESSIQKWALVAALCLANACFAGNAPTITMRNDHGLALSINVRQGTYTVRYRGKPWLGKGLVSVLVGKKWYRSARVRWPQIKPYAGKPGRLHIEDEKQGSGVDRLGAYDSAILTWTVPHSDVRLITKFKLYRKRPYLIFSESFPNGFRDYATGDWTVPRVVFPQFLTGLADSKKNLYSWVSGGLDTQRFGYGPATALSGTVDVLLLSDAKYHAMVLSPFSHYLVATQQSRPVATQTEPDPTKASINCGIEGLIKDIPPGFEQDNVLVVGSGVTRTLRYWGRLLLKRAGKAVPSKYAGVTMKYPTYWDDYGAYYMEHGFRQKGYSSYEDIILGIAKSAKEHGLKIGAYEIDDSNQMLFTKGRFAPRPSLFPHGLRWLHKKLGAALIGYTSWIAAGGPYRKHYKYYATGSGNVLGWPEGSMGDVFYGKKYWRFTANKLASWGVVLLQQDYLSDYDGNPVMMAGLHRMSRYLKNQAAALEAKGILMQYCMTLPRNIMQSTENPLVISLQGGSDHHVYMAQPHPRHENDDPYDWKQMMFGSALYSAVGLWPSRDNIQTVADPDALQNLLFANLLGGEIQLGHKIGEADFKLIARTYRNGDDLILKPDRPIVPLDICYHTGCAVGDTYSQNGVKRWYYILSFPPSGRPLPTISMADFGRSQEWYVYDFALRAGRVVHDYTPLQLRDFGKYQYLIAAPLFSNGMTVIGDVSKFVTMSRKIVPAARTVGNSLAVSVRSDDAQNPIITGYSKVRPPQVRVDARNLREFSSLARLQQVPSGWFWDMETHLWYVKVDFASEKKMVTKTFTVF